MTAPEVPGIMRDVVGLGVRASIASARGTHEPLNHHAVPLLRRNIDE
jgi:hypothetical protein